MASLSRVLLESLVPLLAQDAPAPAPPQLPAPPWVVVDSPEASPWDFVSGLQLVVLSDGTYVGSYQHVGHYSSNRGTYVVRSGDRGATWKRLKCIENLHSVSLIAHNDVVWLLGLEGTSASSPSPVAVMCTRDAGETWEDGVSRLRREDGLQDNQDTVIHAGRVWRSFSRQQIVACAAMRTQVFVASAALGANLQDPASWRWSGELPSDCFEMRPSSRTFLVDFGGDLTLAVFSGTDQTLRALADIRGEGWWLRKRGELPPWTLPSVHAWSLIRDPVDGGFHLLTAEPTRDAVPPETNAPQTTVVLRSSKVLQEWTGVSLLQDAREQPVEFKSTLGLVEDDDLLALLSYEEPMPRNKSGQPLTRTTVAFLRVPKFRERTADSPPLCCPPFPR